LNSTISRKYFAAIEKVSGSLRPIFFRQRNEQRASRLKRLRFCLRLLESLRVSAARNGRFGRDDADFRIVFFGNFNGFARARTDDADDIDADFSRIFGSASAEAVLQATTSSFMPRAAKNCEFSIAYRSTVASDFVP
jgi:hypothetical protein